MEKTDLPKILSLKSDELIDWCNARKKEKHLSNAKLSELTNVPEGTLDRIFTGKNPEFRYSTIQPIVALLIGFDDETPEDESGEYYATTIEGYKLIVENKNHIIDELKKAYAELQKETDYLREENERKHNIITDNSSHIKWLEGIINEIRDKVKDSH